ncbi:MAG: hypothetical protein ACUZ8H_16450 [Candidatus Anammoxibacter sp.]
MSLTTDPEIIYTTMRESDWKFFKVSSSSNKLMCSMVDPNKTLEESIAKLEHFLTFQEGLINISIFSKVGKGGDNTSYNYTIKVGKYETNNPADSGTNPGMNAGNFETRLSEQIANLEARFELKTKITDLERELKEEVKEGNPMADKIIGLVGNYLNQKAAPVPAPVISGNEADTAKVNTEKIRLHKAISTLAHLDDKFLIHMEKFAELAETKPELYKIAIEQLMNL